MKKSLLKVLSVATILALSLGFASCAKKEEAKKQLVMATNAAFPPYEFVEANEFAGIDVEIAGAIADKLGMELVIEDVEFGSIISGVVSGKYDIGMAGMTVTEERLQSVNFSSTYAIGIQSIIVPEGSPITSIDELCSGNYTVGTQESTTGDIYMRDELGDDLVESYKTGADAVLALTSGKIDAVVIDNQPAIAFVNANEGLMILDTPFAEEEYAIAVSKDNEELLNAINNALADLKADGTIDSIIDKYIASDN